MYVKTSSSCSSAHIDIKCPVACVDQSEDMKAFRNEEKSPKVWHALFTTPINCQAIVVNSSSHGNMISALSDLGSPTAEDFSRAANNELNSPRNATLGSAVKASFTN